MSRRKLSVLALVLALLLPLPAPAATVVMVEGSTNLNAVNLQTAQTGNADSTNTVDRGQLRGSCLLRINATAGGTPTVTVNLLGSMDNSTFYNVAYAASATPETAAVAAIVLTSTATTYYILRPSHPWRYLKLNMSANTNMTLTTDVWCHVAV